MPSRSSRLDGFDDGQREIVAYCFRLMKLCIQKISIETITYLAVTTWIGFYAWWTMFNKLATEVFDASATDVGSDIADLVYLVNYMFNMGPAPIGCSWALSGSDLPEERRSPTHIK